MMKKLIVSFLIFGNAIVAMGQQPQTWCGTDQILEEYFERNPDKRAAFYEEQINLTNALPAKGSQNSKTAVITIPVVIHVMHLNGVGNITREQIDDALRIINEDYQRLNPDSADIRSIFRPHISNPQIEFKLARIDPNGNCTEGINRINTPLTNRADEPIKALSFWDANRYFNIWVVNNIVRGNIPGRLLGYAQFPSNRGNLATYGVVIRNDEFGSIGTSSTDGRTLTHEIGHCFNLFHPFERGCGNFCATSGDFVCDTPPQASRNNNSCDTTLNTCSNDINGGDANNFNPYTSDVPDQLENFMSNGLACLRMFTNGQTDRMLASLNSVNNLRNLMSSSNLEATGTDPNFVPQECAPIAEINNRQQNSICIGETMTFTENSFGGTVDSYFWEFPGATPSTSTSATPTVTYTTSGEHDVTLRVSNSAGSNELTLSNFVFVVDSVAEQSGFGYNEGFEGNTANQFMANSTINNLLFRRTSSASNGGRFSFFLNNFANDFVGESYFLISPAINLSEVDDPTFQFDVAFKSQTGSSDQLRCAFSTDCGRTWMIRAVFPTSSISTGVQNIDFIPSDASDWRTLEVTTTSEIASSRNVLFRFEFISGGGNNIYIDNLRTNGTVGIEPIEDESIALSLYPNPTSDDQTTLAFTLEENAPNSVIYMTDILGKAVKEIYRGELNTNPYQFNINTADLESGIYFLSIQAGNKRNVQKLFVN